MKCFLSYSHNAQTNRQEDIFVLKELLIKHKISYIDPLERVVWGDSVADSVTKQIKDSDFVLAILDQSMWVAFELGVAIASKKPVFVIVPTRAERHLPGFLSDITYTRAEPSDFQKISYSFEPFLRNLSSKRKKTTVQKDLQAHRDTDEKSPPINLLSIEYVASLANFENLRGREFEKIVGEIFAKLNLGAVAQNRSKIAQFPADYSLWIDEFSSVVGNPIIVEAKNTSNRGTLNQAIVHLTSYLNRFCQSSQVGFLIYNNSTNKKIRGIFSVSPLIISISIQDLLTELTKITLPEIIIKLRNEVLHGTL